MHPSEVLNGHVVPCVPLVLLAHLLCRACMIGLWVFIPFGILQGLFIQQLASRSAESVLGIQFASAAFTVRTQACICVTVLTDFPQSHIGTSLSQHWHLANMVRLPDTMCQWFEHNASPSSTRQVLILYRHAVSADSARYRELYNCVL